MPRANIWALKDAGCTHVIASTACGSLKEEIAPGDLVILDSFIDRTNQRQLTFFDGKTPGAPKGVCHVPMESPYDEGVRKVLIETAKELGIRCHPTGTSICIEGPRFSTRAESNVFRSWGAATVNMTTVPEVIFKKMILHSKSKNFMDSYLFTYMNRYSWQMRLGCCMRHSQWRRITIVGVTQGKKSVWIMWCGLSKKTWGKLQAFLRKLYQKLLPKIGLRK